MKYNISEILIDQGRYDEAEPLLREVIRVWRASGADGDVAEGQRELARLLARRGDIEGARPLARGGARLPAATGKQGEVLRTDARIAEMLLIAGQSDEALVVIDGADHLACHDRWRLRPGADAGPPTRLGLRPERTHLRRGGGALLRRLARRWRENAAKRLEEALTLDGIATFRAVIGRPSAEITSWRAALFTQLGIVDAPPFATVAGTPGR